jgi:hypothetical protein
VPVTVADALKTLSSFMSSVSCRVKASAGALSDESYNELAIGSAAITAP